MNSDKIEKLRNDLLDRVRLVTAGDSLTENRQFGGNSFMLNGNMLCCIGKHGMMARVGKDQENKALEHKHARPCDITGRRMGGMVIVDFAGLQSEESVAFWIAMARKNVAAMPPKEKKKKAS
jgi:hypothetical protein